MFHVRFWGTRGTAAPYRTSPEFGCHTTAVEIQGEKGVPFFIDLGTGIAPAAANAIENGVREFIVFLTHLHLDHVSGACGFMPFFRDDCTVTVYSEHAGTREALDQILSPPLFPLHFGSFSADVKLVELPETGDMMLPDRGLRVTWRQAAHPQGVTALRVDDGENAFVFATDIELADRSYNRDFERMLREPFPATLAAIDGFFSEGRGDYRENWGHSSWEQAADIAAENGVGTLVITHHNPRYGDEELREMEIEAGGPRWARDGQCWELRDHHAEESC